MADAAHAETEYSYDATPAGQAKRWAMEIQAALKEVEEFHRKGLDVQRVYQNKRTQGQTGKRWTLFTSNVQTQAAMMYGKVPKVSVDRRYADAQDDIARVASEIQERQLNLDVASPDDTFAEALANAQQDAELPGLGVLRWRYVPEFEVVPEQPARVEDGVEVAPATPEGERKVSERVEADYVSWRGFLWGAGAKVWRDVRWIAFEALMPREALLSRFGDKIGREVSLNAGKKNGDKSEDETNHPWGRARVWEIWCKEEKRVYWYVEGYGRTLDEQDDPLGLTGFWPCPRPMMRNLTTEKLVPVPDYELQKDLYEEVNELSTRINLLTKACRAAGLYDRANEGVKRLLKEGGDNELIPVDNWAMFAEKGGIKGAVDWLPLDQIVNAITMLSQKRAELVDALYQLTGMSDILRGQQTANGTPGEAQLKAKFGSVRVQAKQDELARFASDAQRIRAEIIAKHFDPETIIAQSNARAMYDAELVDQAVALIKSDSQQFRISIKPEDIAMTDFAALRAERLEVLDGLTRAMTAMAPIAQQMPQAIPAMLRILQWSVAGLKGSSEIEGVLDRAIVEAEQAASAPKPPPPPDSKVEATRLKVQGDMQKTQAELEADLIRLRAEAEAENAKQQAQTEWNLRERMGEAQIEAAKPRPEPSPTTQRGRPT